MAFRAGAMAESGKAVPDIEKLRTAQRLHILIDMRSDGVSPKTNMPKPCEDRTARSPNKVRPV